MNSRTRKCCSPVLVCHLFDRFFHFLNVFVVFTSFASVCVLLLQTAGEDPVLVGEFSKSFIQGIAGNRPDGLLLAASAPKHFSCYSGPENWPAPAAPGIYRWTFDALVADKFLTEYFHPAWQAAIGTGLVRGPMCSYNAVNGVASCSNDFFNNELMRREWGLDGFVVSDCGEIRGLDVEDNHGTSAHPYVKQANGSMSCRAALRGGCDADCGSTFDAHLQEALVGGQVSASDILTAARRLLKPQFELGLCDGVHAPGAALGPEDVDTEEHRALALEAGIQGITLLKNDPVGGTGEPLLPLSRGARVAVIGAAANFTHEMLSNYAGWNTVVNAHSPLSALQQNPHIDVVSVSPGVPYVEGDDTSLVPAATAAAREADVVLLFIGTNPRGNIARCPSPPGNCVKTTEGEAVDRLTLKMPGSQPQLVRAVVEANANVVLVMINGGPLAIEWEAESVPTILEAFFPGSLGGDAIAKVLTGERQPAGRLPYTMYPASFVSRNMTDYNLTSGLGLTHMYYRGKPTYEFGWGMGYSSFSFQMDDTRGHRVVAIADIMDGGPHPLSFAVVVTNIGARASAVSVQGFLKSDHDDAPVRELFNFTKTKTLRPGERERLELTLSAKVLALVDLQGDEYLSPGSYEVLIGGAGSGAEREADFARTAFSLVGERRFLFRLTEARRRWIERKRIDK